MKAITIGGYAPIVSGAATNYGVHTPSGRIIVFFSAQANTILAYAYSDDEGLTWDYGRLDSAISGLTQIAIWYDRWSGINADLIHIAHTNVTDDDVRYLTIDAVTLAATTAVVAFAGASTASGSWMSITRARGGNLILCGQIDAAAEVFSLKSTTVGASASFSAIATSTEATTDQGILLPGWNADTQDVQLIFWDASADEISVKRYDDSANTWTETSIATSMVDQAATTSYPHFSASVDLTNSRNVLVAWTAVDTANADLRCWTIDDTTITEVTNVVQDSTDDQGLAGVSIDALTGKWTVYYCGKTDGSETFRTNIGIYSKESTDSGGTWTSEKQELANKIYSAFDSIKSFPIVYGRNLLSFYVRHDATNFNLFKVICEPTGRGANGQIGMN